MHAHVSVMRLPLTTDHYFNGWPYCTAGNLWIVSFGAITSKAAMHFRVCEYSSHRFWNWHFWFRVNLCLTLKEPPSSFQMFLQRPPLQWREGEAEGAGQREAGEDWPRRRWTGGIGAGGSGDGGLDGESHRPSGRSPPPASGAVELGGVRAGPARCALRGPGAPRRSGGTGRGGSGEPPVAGRKEGNRLWRPAARSSGPRELRERVRGPTGGC